MNAWQRHPRIHRRSPGRCRQIATTACADLEREIDDLIGNCCALICAASRRCRSKVLRRPLAGERSGAEFRDAGTSSQRSCSSTVASRRRLAHPTHQLVWIPSGIRKEPPALTAGGWCDQRLAT